MSEPAPEAAEPEPLGLRCRRCGCCDLRARNTIRLPSGRIRRYRVCRHCNTVNTTLELPAKDVRDGENC